MQVQNDYSTAVHKQRKESYLVIGVYIVEIVAYCAFLSLSLTSVRERY